MSRLDAHGTTAPMSRRVVLLCSALVISFGAGCVIPTTSEAGSGGSTTAESCEAFTACGGTLDGTWQIYSACVDGELAEATFAQSGAPEACRSLYSSVELAASGTLSYSGTTETSRLLLRSTTTALYTQECAQALNGDSTTVTAESCANVESSLSDATTTATCNFDGDALCTCKIVRMLDAGSAVDTYAAKDGTLSYLSSSNTMQYCVQGTTARFRAKLQEGIDFEVSARLQ